MAYDGIMMSRVVENLQSQLERGRINKIYQISQYELNKFSLIVSLI